MKFVIFLKVFVGLSHLYVNRYDEVCNIFKAYYYLWLTIDLLFRCPVHFCVVVYIIKS